MGFYVLHIGKTGGSAVRHALRPLGRRDVVVCGHDTTLADMPEGYRAIVGVRHPVARFVSGFYSRLRQGRPLYNGPWNEAEAMGFARFKTANALAEALWSDDPQAQAAARDLKGSTGHLDLNLGYWLGDLAALARARPRIALIMDQKRLDADFERLKRLLGAPEAKLPLDPVARHDTPTTFDQTLSARGEANLRRWYAEDIVLYEACLAMREEMIAALDQAPRDAGS